MGTVLLRVALVPPWIVCATGWAYFTCAMLAVEATKDLVKEAFR